jgi:hypothetical protein
MHSLGLLELVLIFVLGGIVILPLWGIFSKAGYPGVMSLGMLVPLLNLALICFLGFSEWPVLKELKALREGGAVKS